MTENKPIMIDGVDVSGCVHYKNNGKCRIPHYQQSIKYTCCNCNEWDCYYKQLARKTQECEELKEYHNKCCQEFEKEKQDLINKYNQLSRDFYSGKYCNVEKCKQLAQLKASKERAEQKLKKIEAKCNETLKLINKDSGTNAYAGGRCTEAGQILHIIDEVE